MPIPSSAAQTPPTDTPQPPTPQKGKGKGCLIVGIIVGLLLLLTLGGLGWWGYSYMQENNLNWEELLSGGSIAKNEEKDTPETSTDEGTPFDNEGEELNEQSDSIATPSEEGEKPATSEGNDEKANEREENSKKEEARKLAESGRKLAERMEFPVVAYNAEPQHDMYYRDEEGDIGVKFDLKKQRSRTSIGTMEITHWLSGKKETFTLQPCGSSLYRLVNPKDPNKKTYLFVYQGGKKLIMGDQHSKQHLTKN